MPDAMADGTCKRCGNPIGDGDRDCPHCGQPVRAAGWAIFRHVINLALLAAALYFLHRAWELWRHLD